jgi:hypothetical protein
MLRATMIMIGTAVIVVSIFAITFQYSITSLNESDRLQREYVIEHFGNDIGFSSYLEYQKFNNFTEYTNAKDIGKNLHDEGITMSSYSLIAIVILVGGMILSSVVPEKWDK